MTFDSDGAELTVVPSTGRWSLDLSGLPLADGVYDVEATQTDEVGNTSDDTTTGELNDRPDRCDSARSGRNGHGRSRAHPDGNLRSQPTSSS